MTSREPREKGRLDRKLLAGLLGAGTAALAGRAEASPCNPPGVLTGSVCYTDPPDATAYNGGGFLFDFDHDGDAEFKVEVSSYGYVYYATVWQDASDEVTAVVGALLTPLVAGAEINLANATHPLGHTDLGMIWGWGGLGPRHGGVRIQLSDGTVHLGWARLTVSPTPYQYTGVTLHDFAFSITPGAPILAGQTTPVELQSFEIE